MVDLIFILLGKRQKEKKKKKKKKGEWKNGIDNGTESDPYYLEIISSYLMHSLIVCRPYSIH